MKHRFKDKRLMQLLLLFGMICLALPLFSASLCYQEATNHSSASDGDCALNYSGNTYVPFGYGNGYDNGQDYDGDWETSTACYVGEASDDRREDYAMPNENVTGVIIQFKTYQGIFNISMNINHTCYATPRFTNILSLWDWGSCNNNPDSPLLYDPMALYCEDWSTIYTLHLSEPTCSGATPSIENPEPPPDFFYYPPAECISNGQIYEMGVYWILADEILSDPTSGMSITNLQDPNQGITDTFSWWANYVGQPTPTADFSEVNSDDDGCVYDVYVDGNYIVSGNSLLAQGIGSGFGLGTHNITYSTTGCENYSNGTIIYYFNIVPYGYTGTFYRTDNSGEIQGLGGDIGYQERTTIYLTEQGCGITSCPDDGLGGYINQDYLNNSGGFVGYNRIHAYNNTPEIVYDTYVDWTIILGDPTYDSYWNLVGYTMFLTVPANQDYNGSSLNINAVQTIPLDTTGCIFELWINGINVSSGNPISYDYVFDAGIYDVNYSAYGCYNFFNNSLYQQFTINKATPSLSLIADSILVNQGDNNNVSASYIMPDDISGCEFNFYRNGILINSSSGSNSGFIDNTQSFLSGHYDYVYNVTGCTNYNYAQQTLGIDILGIAYPEIRIYNPLPISYNYLINELNFSITNSISLDSCWYSLDNGETNVTTDCSLNITGLISVQGTNTWTIWANDSLNQINTSSVTFIVDTMNPEIYLVSPLDNYETYNTTLDYTYYVDDATSGIKNTTIYVYNASNFLSHREVSYSSGSKIKIFALPYGNYTWYADVWDNLGNFNSTEIRYLSIIEEPEAEIPQTIGFTEQGQIIYSVMSSAGAGLGIFMNFMSVALPPLLIILGLIGVVVIIAYFIISSIKIKPLGVR